MPSECHIKRPKEPPSSIRFEIERRLSVRVVRDLLVGKVLRRERARSRTSAFGDRDPLTKDEDPELSKAVRRRGATSRRVSC